MHWRGGNGQLGTGKGHAGRVVVYRDHVPTARVKHPFGDMQPATRSKGQQDLPVPVAALAGIPLHVVRIGADRRQPLGGNLSKARAGG
jgi:hypothetical protein